MGTWNSGSADCDGVLDWYPEHSNSKELNAVLKKWLGLGSEADTGDYAEAEFLGIVIMGLSKGVVASKAYLKKALSVAQNLSQTNDYLESYSDSKKRKAALKKEILQLQKALAGDTSFSRVKLTTSLFEVLAKGKTSASKKKTAKKLKSKVERPSPSESATLFKPGTKKKGNNGKMWKVVLTKSKVHRWSPI